MQTEIDMMLQEIDILSDAIQIEAIFMIRSNLIENYDKASDQDKIDLVKYIKTRFFKEIDIEQNEHLKAALERIKKLGEYIEKLPDDMIHADYLVNGKIKHIRDLYNVIKNIKQDAEEKLLVDEIYKLYQTIEDVKLSVYMHDEIIKALKSNKDNIMLFSIGSSGNPEQYKPKFTDNLTDNVIVCNFDRARYKTEDLNYVNNKHDVRFFSNTCFPLDPKSFGGKENERVHKKRTQILNNYIQLLVEKKKQQPEFKLVLLFCCDAYFNQSLIEIAKACLANGYRMDDLKLVHDYHEESPAVIYNDIDKIPVTNLLFVQSDQNLMHNVEADKIEKIKEYTKLHDMIFYPNIKNISSADLYGKKYANEGIVARIFSAVYSFFKLIVNSIFSLFFKQKVNSNSSIVNTQSKDDKIKSQSDSSKKFDQRLSKPYVAFTDLSNQNKKNTDQSPANTNKPGNKR